MEGFWLWLFEGLKKDQDSSRFAPTPQHPLTHLLFAFHPPPPLAHSCAIWRRISGQSRHCNQSSFHARQVGEKKIAFSFKLFCYVSLTHAQWVHRFAQTVPPLTCMAELVLSWAEMVHVQTRAWPIHHEPDEVAWHANCENSVRTNDKSNTNFWLQLIMAEKKGKELNKYVNCLASSRKKNVFLFFLSDIFSFVCRQIKWKTILIEKFISLVEWKS